MLQMSGGDNAFIIFKLLRKKIVAKRNGREEYKVKCGADDISGFLGWGMNLNYCTNVRKRMRYWKLLLCSG